MAWVGCSGFSSGRLFANVGEGCRLLITTPRTVCQESTSRIDQYKREGYDESRKWLESSGRSVRQVEVDTLLASRHLTGFPIV